MACTSIDPNLFWTGPKCFGHGSKFLDSGQNVTFSPYQKVILGPKSKIILTLDLNYLDMGPKNFGHGPKLYLNYKMTGLQNIAKVTSFQKRPKEQQRCSKNEPFYYYGATVKL